MEYQSFEYDDDAIARRERQGEHVERVREQKRVGKRDRESERHLGIDFIRSLDLSGFRHFHKK